MILTQRHVEPTQNISSAANFQSISVEKYVPIKIPIDNPIHTNSNRLVNNDIL